MPEVQQPMVGQAEGCEIMEFHDLANGYPILSDDELAVMAKGMAGGMDPRFPIVTYQGKILEGRNRYLAANIAEVPHIFKEFEGTEAEAKAFVILANENRRHLKADDLKKRRAERIQRVVSYRRGGRSTRDIAEKEKISQAQVRADSKVGTEQGGAQLNETDIVGKDGKKRKPRKPVSPEEKAKKELAKAEKAAKKAADKLAAERAKVGKARSSGKTVSDADEGPEDPTPDELPLDGAGQEIPQNLRDEFNSALMVDLEAKVAEVAKLVRTVRKWNPFMLIAVSENLDTVQTMIGNAIPFVVCKCGGAGCGVCRDAGWLPKWRHDEELMHV